MGDLSAHFSRREFDCHDGSRANPDPALIACLERLRALIGKPISIVSGYRSESWNARVGGAKNSQHLYNRAADIPSNLRVSVEQAAHAGFTGIGHTDAGIVVHVDVRRVSRPVVFLDRASY